VSLGFPLPPASAGWLGLGCACLRLTYLFWCIAVLVAGCGGRWGRQVAGERGEAW